MKQLFDRLLPAAWRASAVTIPVVRLQGAIASGGSRFRPGLSLESAAAAIEKAFAFKAAPAVAIALNSPGGSPVQSRLIYKRIRDLAEEKNKRVLVFVEDAAASGGYMIALAGDEIIADPSSIVGSIGVVSAGFGFQELMARIGVERRIHTAGDNKAILDPFQPERKEDVERLKALQLEIHDIFIAMVKERRGAKLADAPDLFSGMFWTGGKALELGLVDALGDMRAFLKGRYGDKTRLRLVAAPRGFLARRLGLSRGAAGGEFAALAAEGLANAAQERALWARLGL